MNLKRRWPEILEDEIDAINLSRVARQVPIRDRGQKNEIKRAHAARLAGIAFSGGGIRSATFNLGILQGLANLKLLHIFDYISTVSGGGYIGSWLSAWISRSLQRPLSPEYTDEDFKDSELKRLCASIENDFDSFNFTESRNTIAWLNKLLERNDLYSHLIENKGFTFSKENYQLSKVVSSLHQNGERPVKLTKLLNRLLLDECYRQNNQFFEKKVVDPPRKALNSVVEDLSSIRKKDDVNRPESDLLEHTEQNESEKIGFLRKYSNYLTPRRGFSTDTLTIGVAYVIHFLLNLIVLGLIISTALTAPIIVAKFYPWIASQGSVSSYYLLFAAAILLIVALCLAFTATRDATADERKLNLVNGFLFMFLFSCLFLSIAVWQTPKVLLEQAWYIWSICTSILFGLTLAFGRCVTGFILELKNSIKEKKWQQCLPVVWEFGAALLAGFVSGALLYSTAAFLERWRMDTVSGHWHVAVWSLPIIVVIFAIATVVYSGIAGRDQNEYMREWTFRLWGLLVRYTGIITILLIIVVYGPLILVKAESFISENIRTYLTIGWLASTIGGVILGKSEFLQGKSSKKTINLLVTIAPYVFITGLMLFLSWGLYAFWTKFPVWLDYDRTATLQVLSNVPRESAYWVKLNEILKFWHIPLFGLIGFSIAAVILSYRVGVNEFSLHALYGNRLVRAYLGASNPDSKNNSGTSRRDRFTFFNPTDNDVRLNFLSSFQDKSGIYPGPYPIINTTLNLMKSQNLAWQKRKGASFIFSALYSGYDPDLSASEGRNRSSGNGKNKAYVLSNHYSSQNGVSLGKAMTISGAAASPNMGYYTSAPLAFLMTVFNVRLGWWLANPIKTDAKLLESNGPKIGFSYLLKELFATAGENTSYVYLSDGGHFENLGIYELVKRRCRYIVACDGAQDKEMNFSDLGNAIEKCRTDFGIDILIDVDQIRQQNENGQCAWHCAVGNIRYSKIDKNASDGTLIYIKASLTGDESIDLARYASQHPDFPHQSTADQWFDETQFESYRRLGEHIATTVFGNAEKNTDVRSAEARKTPDYKQLPDINIERFFHELQEQWYPPSEAVAQTFNRHACQLEQIISQLNGDEDLRFLDLQMYPAFSKFEKDLKTPEKSLQYIPQNAEQLRAGFYMCKQMLIFMESVYHDLNLDREFSHPDNRGWINLFQRWAWSRMFRFTWSVTVSTFGARFQKFCEQRMNFRRDAVQVGLMKNESLSGCEVKGDLIETIQKYTEAKRGPAEAQFPGDSTEKELVEGWKKTEKEFGFNYFERLIIEDLLVTNKKPCVIYPIYINTDSNPLKDDADFRFNVGFTMLDLDRTKIYYFRIQNHLRQMGLARRSLRAFLNYDEFKNKDITTDFQSPSPNGPEIISYDDHEYFEKLLNSVKTESLV